MPLEITAALLARVRRRHWVSEHDVAKRLRVSRAMVNRWACGHHEATQSLRHLLQAWAAEAPAGPEEMEIPPLRRRYGLRDRRDVKRARRGVLWARAKKR